MILQRAAVHMKEKERVSNIFHPFYWEVAETNIAPHHLHRTINYTTFFFMPRTRNLKRSVAPILKRSPLIKIREYITRPAMNTKHPHLEAKRKKHYQPSNDSPIRSTIDLRESKGNGN